MQQYQYHEVNELGLGNSRQQGEVHCHWEVSREVDVACARLPASVALQEKSVTATSLSAGQANSSEAGGTQVRHVHGSGICLICVENDLQMETCHKT